SAARSDSSAVTKTLACAMSRETSTSDTLNDGSPCSATASRTSVPSSLRSCAAMRSVRWKDLVIGTGTGLENGGRRTGNGRNGAGTGMPGRWPCVHRPCCGSPIATDALQRPLDLDALEALDLVARLDVVVGLHRDAALGAVAHFLDVLLEAAQRLQLALEDHRVVAQHADRAVLADHALDHDRTGDGAELGAAEHVADLGDADDLFADLHAQQAGCHLLHLVDHVVDDREVAQVQAAVVDHLARRGV